MSPQHFQQHDRWVERMVDERASGLSPSAWGLRRITIDEQDLAMGRIVVTSLRAVLPDGTVVRAPEDVALPPAKKVSTGDAGMPVKIVLPLRAGDGVELGRSTEFERTVASEIEARDATGPDRPAVRITVGVPNLRVAIGDAAVEDCCELPVGRIHSVEPGGAVELDRTFMGPCLDIHAVPAMLEAARETHRLLSQRGIYLAERAGPTQSDADTAGLLDIILLSVINRQELLFQHLSQMPGTHPEALYRAMISVVAELTAFLGQVRRPDEVPPYIHATPEAVFPPLLARIQQLLASVTERKAIRIPLEQKNYGIWIGQIGDRSIFTGCRLILVRHGQRAEREHEPRVPGPHQGRPGRADPRPREPPASGHLAAAGQRGAARAAGAAQRLLFRARPDGRAVDPIEEFSGLRLSRERRLSRPSHGILGRQDLVDAALGRVAFEGGRPRPDPEGEAARLRERW